jgi:hypothetical protein
MGNPMHLAMDDRAIGSCHRVIWSPLIGANDRAIEISRYRHNDISRYRDEHKDRSFTPIIRFADGPLTWPDRPISHEPI